MKRRLTGPAVAVRPRGLALWENTCGVSSHDRHVQARSSHLLGLAGGSVRDTEVIIVAGMMPVSAVRPSLEPRPPRCEGQWPGEFTEFFPWAYYQS